MIRNVHNGCYHLCSKATDADTGNGSVVWFSIESPDAPFVVEKDTGEVTTAGVFRGQSGTSLAVQIRAYDNFGMPPTQSNSSILTVSAQFDECCMNYD